MKEISPKLANELLERIEKIERFCDSMAKKGRPRKYDVDSDWMTVSCMAFEMKMHLLWHISGHLKCQSVGNKSKTEGDPST